MSTTCICTMQITTVRDGQCISGYRAPPYCCRTKPESLCKHRELWHYLPAFHRPCRAFSCRKERSNYFRWHRQPSYTKRQPLCNSATQCIPLQSQALRLQHLSRNTFGSIIFFQLSQRLLELAHAHIANTCIQTSNITCRGRTIFINHLQKACIITISVQSELE